MMREVTHEPRQGESSHPNPRRTSRIARCSSLIAALCGFVALFGIAHLLLIHITKPSGYLFFGTLATVPLVVVALLFGFTSDRHAVVTRFGFGALMCIGAIPVIYLARFTPDGARPTVRNLLGLPFFLLALAGPRPFLRPLRHDSGA